MNSTGNVVTTIADVILLTVDFKTFYVGLRGEMQTEIERDFLHATHLVPPKPR